MVSQITRFHHLLVLVAVSWISADGFTTSSAASRHAFHTPKLKMGLFDGISKAFKNEAYSAPPEGNKATARHILVATKKEAAEVLDKIRSGASFNEVVKYSTCPSSAQGGSLGSFAPGTMVKEFDDVIFSADTPIGDLMGPVRTKFGYHLIVVDKRTGS
jgi:peptidyl-prolyl cis-trans isomerase C